MTVEELRAALAAQGVRKRAYDFDCDFDHAESTDEVYCLDLVKGRWSVYYRERGIRRDERFFESEDEACRYVFKLSTRDPTTYA